MGHETVLYGVCALVDVLEANLAEINMLTPWGGRMLSLVDLVHRDTLPLAVAAYLLDGVQMGASVLIGAWPNRAGKTTLMGALLGVIPPSDRIIIVDDARMVPQLTAGAPEQLTTYVIPEISRHGWGYLWGPPVVAVTRLVDSNTRLVTNLHADSVDEVTAVFGSLGSKEAVHVFRFIIFINPPRVVDEVWEFDPSRQSHTVIYSSAHGVSPDFYGKPNSQQRQRRTKWETFLSQCLNHDIFRIEDVAYALREYRKE